MSIREVTCPAHGHPVGPDDLYCGACGTALRRRVEGSRQTWPKLVPDAEATPASITPIRPEVEFKPLDFSSERPSPRRRFARHAAAVLATIACASLLLWSEIMLAETNNDTVWVVMWLAAYAGTVIAAVGWISMLIHRVRQARRPGGGNMASAH